MTGEMRATRDALDWLPPFPASDVVNQARSAALVEVEQLIGLGPGETPTDGQLLEALPLGLVHHEVGVEIHP